MGNPELAKKGVTLDAALRTLRNERVDIICEDGYIRSMGNTFLSVLSNEMLAKKVTQISSDRTVAGLICVHLDTERPDIAKIDPHSICPCD